MARPSAYSAPFNSFQPTSSHLCEPDVDDAGSNHTTSTNFAGASSNCTECGRVAFSHVNVWGVGMTTRDCSGYTIGKGPTYVRAPSSPSA